MAEKELTIRISARDMSAPEMAKAREALAGIGLEAKQVNANMRTAAGGTSAFSGVLGPLVGMMSVGAIVSFGKEILNDADALVKLSDKTGIAIEPLQRIKYAAEQSGNTFEQVTSAVSMMQKRLAEGDKSAVGALKQLGIELDAFLAMSPDQQFVTIADKVSDIEDPMRRVKVATELFGRAGAEVLPTLIADVKKLGDEAPIMSDKATKAFDDVGDAISRTWQRAKNAAGEGLADTAAAINDFRTKIGFVTLGEIARAQADAMATLRDSVPKLTGGIQSLVSDGLKPATLSGQELDAVMKGLEAQNKKSLESNKAAAEAAKKAADAQQKWNTEIKDASEQMYWLTSSGSGLPALIPLVNESGRAMIGAALAANSWTDEIADGTKSNAGFLLQLPTIKKNIEDVGAAAQKQVGPLGSFFGAIKTGASGLVDGLTGGNGLSGFFANIGTGITDQLGAMLTGGMSTIINMGIGLAWEGAKKIAGYFREAFGGASAEELAGRDVVKGFEANIKAMLSEGQKLEAGNESWKQTVVVVRDAYLALGKTEAEALAAVKALWDSSRGGAGAVADAMKPIQDALDAVKLKSSETGKSLDELRAEGIAAGNAIAGAIGAGGGRGAWSDWDPGPREYPMGGMVPGFASGVKNFGGGLALVGESGPELVRLPRGADVLPSAGTAGAFVASSGATSGGLSGADVDRLAARFAQAVAGITLDVRNAVYLDGDRTTDAVLRRIPARAGTFRAG